MCVFFAPTGEAKACGDGQYVVSAYYSPLPGQSFYATGTYVGDIRLNGGGVTTASGVKVADATGAFLAAPPCFEFGTILEFEGMGNYIILDRGGAIKGSRLDLWTGYGEEGLRAALSWGKRTVEVNTLGKDANVELVAKAEWKLPPKLSFLKGVDSNPFQSLDNIKIGDTGAKVAVLQQLLTDIGYFVDDVDGYFGLSTKTALLEMDKDYGEIVSINISPIGALGNTTIAEVEELVMTARRKFEEDIPATNLGLGSKGIDVLNLQKSLKKLGYTLDLSEVFDEMTEEALIAFQIKEGVIDSRDHVAAGYFGTQTQAKLKESLKISLPDQVGVIVEDESYDFLPNNEMFENTIKLGETSEDVRKLQEVLRRMSLFRIEPTGYFGPVTQHAVIKMQLKYNLIDRVSEEGAGVVGPSTRRLLNRFQNQYLKRLNTEFKAYDVTQNKLFDTELSLGDNSKEVFKLQKFLQEQGYLDSVLLTKFYGDMTFKAMAEYKIDNNLIDNVSEFNSGNLDNDTIEFINRKFR